MYNFSGIWFRIWGVDGVVLILEIVVILIKILPKKNIKLKECIKECKMELFAIVFAIVMGLSDASGIWSPDVLSYTGKFVVSHTNSRVAPPLPVTYEYVFWNGEGERRILYLDVFSMKEIFPYEFVRDQEYTIYFDKGTKVILKVEVVE